MRTLAGGAADSLPQIQVTWLTPDGRLDKGRLLRTFMEFWAQHGEPLLRTAPYHEVAPHLVLMALSETRPSLQLRENVNGHQDP